MKARWIRKSLISNTSHQRPAPHSGTPARHGPSRCSPWLVPSHTTTSLPENTQLKCEAWWTISLVGPPTSPEQPPHLILPRRQAPLGEVDLSVVSEQVQDAAAGRRLATFVEGLQVFEGH